MSAQMPESLSQELEKVLNSARNERLAEPLGKNTKQNYLFAFQIFFKVISQRHPGRQLMCLTDFTEDDAKEFKTYLENQQYEINSITSYIMGLKGIFKAALDQNSVLKNIFKNIKYHWHKAEKGHKLSKEEVEKLCPLLGTVKWPSLNTQFRRLRDIAMMSVQVTLALRSEDVIRLCAEDILMDRKDKGVVPVLIREGKDRPAGWVDTVPLTPWALERLNEYLEVRDKLCQNKKISPQQIKSLKTGKIFGTALFFNERHGGQITKSGYYRIFIAARNKNGLNSEYTPHDLRRTHISWLIDDRLLAPEDVQKLARHNSLKTTYDIYYKHDDKSELLKRFAQHYGNNFKNNSEIPKDLIPDESIRRKLLRCAVEQAGGQWNEEVFRKIDQKLIGDTNNFTDLYYTVGEVRERLKIARSQVYARIKWGALHPLKYERHTVFLRSEVDQLGSYLSSKEASKILGLKEKRPTTVCHLAKIGALHGYRWGNNWWFLADDLRNYRRDKKINRVRESLRRKMSKEK